MTERPFHHGNLRAALLDEAAIVLRESGVEGLSLRDLARRAGVSHGAPRSHFPDRRALLDALAELGFDRLATKIRHAIKGNEDLRDRFSSVARAYVDFAIDDAALMELMFQAKIDGTPGAVHDAAGALFTELDKAIGPRPAEAADGDDSRDLFKMLFAATMQGIAVLVVSQRIDRSHCHRLIEAATDAMLQSDLATRSIRVH